MLSRIPRKLLSLVRSPIVAARERADRTRREKAREERRRALAPLAEGAEPVVLFLVPEAGLTPYLASHAILARSVIAGGGRAVVLSCEGVQPVCSWKSALQVGATASGDTTNLACQTCKTQALVTGEDYDLADVSIEQLVTAEEHEEIRRLLAANADDVWSLVHDGVQFGAFAAGEALRWRRRSKRSEFTEEDRALGRALLESALLIYKAVTKLSERWRLARICFIGDYSYWLPLQPMAERRGIGVTTIDHAYNNDVDRRLICLREGSVNVYMRRQVENWARYRDTPIDPPSIATIADSSLFRLAATYGVSIHSPVWARAGNAIKDQLGLSHDRRTIVAYSSSMDEFVAINELMGAFGRGYATEPRPFVNQVDWLRALNDWVASREDLQLVIRLHPRIAIGWRFAEAATEYHQLKRAFASVSERVKIIWPEDKISSYNLAEVADAATVAWSSIGIELARFGIPTVAAFPDVAPFPVRGFVDFHATPADYFAAIERAFDRGTSPELVTEAFRWTHYMFRSVAADVSDVVPTFNYEPVPPCATPGEAATLNRVLLGGEDLAEMNMARLSLSPEARRLEHEAVTRTLRRFFIFFMSGRDRPDASVAELRLHADGAQVACAIDGENFVGDTRLLRRLAAALLAD